MNRTGSPSFSTAPLTPAVRILLFVTLGIWLVLQILGEGIFHLPVMHYFSLVPESVIEGFQIWRVVSYLFLHTTSIFHIGFNMLSLWMIGGELEQRWGKRFFTFYYLSSGIGAALIYCLGVAIYTVFTGSQLGLRIPVVGASGAIFGLLLAYGLLFGERQIYFWGIFPMKAKILVLIMGGVEVVSLINSGVSGGEVANLAHIGGLIAGYLTLLGYTRFQRLQWGQKSKKRKSRNLRLVVDNENSKGKTGEGPKYWN